MLKKKLPENSETEVLKGEVENWKNKYLRALADYQNLEKRVSLERETTVKFAARSLTFKLLDVLDSLRKADTHLNDAGLTLALKQFTDILKAEQLEHIDVLGKKFDPHVMECVEVNGNGNDDTVTEELSPGYTMYGVVIRPAKVKVGKRTVTQDSTNKTQN